MMVQNHGEHHISNPQPPGPSVMLCLCCLPSSFLLLVLEKPSTDMTSSRKPSLTNLNNYNFPFWVTWVTCVSLRHTKHIVLIMFVHESTTHTHTRPTEGCEPRGPILCLIHLCNPVQSWCAENVCWLNEQMTFSRCSVSTCWFASCVCCSGWLRNQPDSSSGPFEKGIFSLIDSTLH